MAPSPTMAVDGRAKELRAQGIDIINFSAGEPDFPTPEHIKDAARDAIAANLTRYTPVAGTNELRAAIADKLARENGLEYSPAEVVVCNGGKQALYNAFMALCEPGDEVIIIAPYWVSYPEQVALTGARPVFVKADPEQRFHVSAEAIAAAITPRTRMIVLNSPNNPTGAVFNRVELEAVAEMARQHDLWVVSDEIYEHLIYGEHEHFSIASLPGMKERSVVINGVSKAYAMTGWRVGYAAAPKPVVDAMAALQGHVSSGISSISQAAATAALNGSFEPVRAMAAEYDRRRRHIVERVNRLPGLRCDEPEGAFYVFVDARELIGKPRVASDVDLAAYLLDEGRVAVVPGVGFGWEGYLRISYATSMELIDEGLDRMERALAQLV